MRVLVTGSRPNERFDWGVVAQLLADVLGELPPETVIATGGAKGVDRLAHIQAGIYGFKREVFPAQWGVHEGCNCPPGRKVCNYAGLRRNVYMLDTFRPQKVLGFWDVWSNGTRHCLKEAAARDLPITIYQLPGAAPFDAQGKDAWLDSPRVRLVDAADYGYVRSS